MTEIQWQKNISWKIPKEYKIETIDEKTSDYWRDFEYWQTKEQLKPWLEVEK